MTPESVGETKHGPGYWQGRRDAETMDRWSAVDLAKAIDAGWVAEWPLEVTRTGRWELRYRAGNA